jgi:hypothetical protein
VYLSHWKSQKAAEAFARLYRASLPGRYPGLRGAAASQDAQTEETVEGTSEGPVLIALHDRYVFISHTLPTALAEKVMESMLAAQTGEAAAQLSRARAARPQARVGLTMPLRHAAGGAGLLRCELPTVY